MKVKILFGLMAFVVLMLPYICISQITQAEAQQLTNFGIDVATSNSVQLVPYVNNDLLGTLITVVLGIVYRAIESRRIRRYYRRKLKKEAPTNETK